MSRLVVSGQELKDRLRDRTFWLQTLASVLVGHVYAAFGFAATFAILVPLKTLIERRGQSLFWDVVAFVFGVVHILSLGFLYMLVFMVATTVVLLPVAVGSALLLQTSRKATMLYGAGVGLFIGWPVALLLFGNSASDLVVALGSTSAGAMFALALWQFCLRHHNAADRDADPGRVTLWWASLGWPAKISILILCLGLMAVSL